MATAIMKLVSGEEIIANIVEETDFTVTVESARSLMVQPTGPGQMGIAMLPWMATMPDDQLDIRTSDIMIRNNDVPKQLEDGYLQQTSGIQIASGNAGIVT